MIEILVDDIRKTSLSVATGKITPEAGVKALTARGITDGAEWLAIGMAAIESELIGECTLGS